MELVNRDIMKQEHALQHVTEFVHVSPLTLIHVKVYVLLL